MVLAQQILLVNRDTALTEKVLALYAECHIISAAHCALVDGGRGEVGRYGRYARDC